MALIVVCSAKGSPGASAVALALAVTWPGQGPGFGKPVVVEADPAGGEVMLRFGLPDSLSLVTLAAAARRTGLSEEVVRAHAQRLQGGVLVVPAPAAAEKSTAALAALESLWAEGEFASGTVVADIGRLGAPLGPVGELVGAADAAVLVTCGSVEELAHAEAAVGRLRPGVKHVVVTVVGPCAWPPQEIAHVLGADQCHLLPVDHATAGVLRGGPSVRPSWLRRRRRPNPLFDAAYHLALGLSQLLPQPDEARAGNSGEPERSGLAAMLGGHKP
ncbi:hypothetical protein [Kitasatospora sp. NPDC001175]|uniref:hypothetical protein n=1 Tax=Kitasatospora sp. NPDC001175 TaxID=3157103 RepID=UPI003CFF455A